MTRPTAAAAKDVHEQIRSLRGEADDLRRALAAAGSDSSAATPNPAWLPGVIPPDFLPGYVFVREIHRGGQGVVYEAQQTATRRRVAIKLLRPTGADSRAVRRFEREAELITQLRHPNVVNVLDAGDRDGFFYLIMEYVDGRPLDAFVADARLEAKSLLRLFAEVCDGVNAAHLRGVIHRDLKPANVLVDENGQPRVLDFGLAKLVAGPRSTAAEAQTVDGQFLGSLPWASPEQAAGEHGNIDIRTDVYSLGVILYQLLTGRFPYDVSGPMRDVMNRIVSAEPARPATIPGCGIDDEVETIVLKCLSKERERRYQSSGDLAADVRRYLSGEAIEAKRESALYRMRKGLRRHRFAVLTAGAFAALLVAATAVSASYWWTARGAAHSAMRERDKSEQFARFMEDVLAGLNPWVTQGQDTALLKQLMDGAAERIRKGELAGSPEAELRLRISIGRVYRVIGEIKAAREMLDPTLDLVRTLGKTETREHADVLGQLAQVHHIKGEFAEALALYDAYVRILTQLDHNIVEPIAKTQCVMIECLRVSQRHDEALDLANHTISMLREANLSDHPTMLSCELQLAFSLENAARPDEALSVFQALLPRMRAHTARDTPYIAWALNGMANCLLVLGRPAEAIPALEEARGILRRFYKPPHYQHMRSSPSLAEALRRCKRFVEAEQCAREAIETLRAHADWDQADRMQAEWYLARILEDTGRPDEAVESLRRSDAWFRERSRPLDQIGAMQMLAEMLLKHGPPDAQEAEDRLRACLELCERILVPRHPMAWMRSNAKSLLGEALTRQSRFAEAEPLLLEGANELRDASGVPPPGRFELDFRRESVRRVVELYLRWHRAAPDAGYDVQAGIWRGKLESATGGSTDSSAR